MDLALCLLTVAGLDCLLLLDLVFARGSHLYPLDAVWLCRLPDFAFVSVSFTGLLNIMLTNFWLILFRYSLLLLDLFFCVFYYFLLYIHVGHALNFHRPNRLLLELLFVTPWPLAFSLFLVARLFFDVSWLGTRRFLLCLGGSRTLL